MKKLKKLVPKDQMPKSELRHILGGFSDLSSSGSYDGYDCEGASSCGDGCKEGCKENCKPGCQTGKK